MAATVSSVWAKPGAWALDSEQNEDELNHQHHLDLSAAAATAAPPSSDFPSLSAAVTTAAKPKKKSKQVLSLAEFSNYKPPSAAASAAADIVLPTGPRERTAEEIAESRRGGFRSYGDRDGKPRVSREGHDGNFAREPSRADGADDWSKGKKLSSFGPGPDRERDMGPSRADGVDDWSKGKKFGGSSGGGFGGGSERREKGGFFNASKADEVDNWAKNKSFGQTPVDDRRSSRRVGFEATGPGSDVDNWVKNKEVVSGNGGGGSGRPRLNLQPRTLPVVAVVANNNNNNNNNNNINNNGGGVGGGNLGGGEAAETVVVKGKGNPFGAARPREEVLKEKGKDWKEIDERLEAVKIKEVERSAGGGGGGESFGRRRGFGVGGGDERSVRSWRKPGSPANDAVPAVVASSETTEQTLEQPAVNEPTQTSEEAPSEN